MTKTLVLLSTLLMAACDVGAVAPNGGFLDGSPGGGGGPDAPGGGDPNACVARGTIGVPHAHAAGGTSNAGQSCVVAGCHLASATGAGAPGFEFAGTVYQANGTTGNGGAAIRVTSAGGTSQNFFADSDGNFYLDSGTLPNPFPAQAEATACPTITKMPDALTQGDCNGCHRSGGTAGAVITLN